MFNLSEEWKEQDPPSCVGVLGLANCPNLPDHPDLAAARSKLVQELIDSYQNLDREALRREPVFAAYEAFYRRFRKTYHVQLQLESVVHKGKPLFSPSALVSAMFMAELKTGLLTAAHDADSLKGQLTASIANGDEVYTRLDGSSQTLKAGDLYIQDQIGILSSVIYGPDHRTRIRQDTSAVIYTTYGPPGISKGQIQDQLEILEGYIMVFAPDLVRSFLSVL